MIHNLNFDAVVLANGDFPTASIPLNILKGASYIACCDGAVIRLDKCGLTPNVIVGDCDSIPASLKSKYSAILHRVEEQETNDLTKTITYLQSTGKKRIAIVGATGKREDHTLGNISLSHVPVISADIGLPQLAMHSCYETAGVKDIAYLVDAITAFYSADLTIQPGGSFSLN